MSLKIEPKYLFKKEESKKEVFLNKQLYRKTTTKTAFILFSPSFRRLTM